MIETMTFEMARIALALTATFEKRGTDVPSDEPEGFTRQYAQQWSNSWARLSDRFELADDLPSLNEVIERIREFLMPVLGAIGDSARVRKSWTAGKGWR
jgi:hypothetical protein